MVRGGSCVTSADYTTTTTIPNAGIFYFFYVAGSASGAYGFRPTIYKSK
jgi:hypothetical protein